jgi:hypothetical protein
VAAGGRTAGPFSVAQLGQGVAAGQLTRESVVWAPGMTAWAPLAQVPRLAILFAPPPPPAG